MTAQQAHLFDRPVATVTAPVLADVSAWSDGLRFYQVEADDAAFGELAKVKRTVIVLFTGAGKTRTAVHFVKRWLAENPGDRALWLAGRDFLIDDAIERLRDGIGWSVSREQAEFHASLTSVVVGSVMTLKGKRLEAWPRDTFGLIVYDECHHAASPGSRKIFEHFERARCLGITATLRRHDGVGAWTVWDSIAYERQIDWGVEQGFFCPIVPVSGLIESVDLSQIDDAGRRNDFGEKDLKLSDVEKEIAENAAAIAHLSAEEMGARPSIVYTPGVESAHLVAETLNRIRPGCARAVDADTPRDERRRILSAFETNEIQWIVNCGIYLEGLDVPTCAGIVIARPTKSESLYIQMAGRGGRPEGWIGQLATAGERRAAIAASGKPNFLLLDITGHAGRHSLCTAATLAGTATLEEKERAEKILEEEEGTDLHTAIARARGDIQREQQEAERKERERLARAAEKAKVKAQRSTWDVFAKYGIDDPDAQGIEPIRGPEPLRPHDVDWLTENKLPTDITRSQCLKLQRTAAAWRSAGLASFKQRNILGRYNLPQNIYKSQASALIDLIAANGWKAPPVDKAQAILTGGREVGSDDA